MIFKSEDKVFDKNLGIETLPVWTLDTDTQTITHIHPKTLKRETYSFHTDQVRYHLHYVEDKNPERLQKLVNEGKIYSYLDDFEIRVTDEVNNQAQILMDNSAEYQKANKSGDLVTLGRIGNMCHEMARESVFNAMVYV